MLPFQSIRANHFHDYKNFEFVLGYYMTAHVVNVKWGHRLDIQEQEVILLQ